MNIIVSGCTGDVQIEEVVLGMLPLNVADEASLYGELDGIPDTDSRLRIALTGNCH